MTKTKQEAKHTPGPWVLGTNGLLEVWPQDQREEKICRFFKAENREQQIENAKLIASAPKLKADRDALLEAAKRALAEFVVNGHSKNPDACDGVCAICDAGAELRAAIRQTEEK